MDVIDPEAPEAGDALADLIRARLGTCTQLLAVVSEATRSSWWVPWEIGVASEKDYPLATYADRVGMLPEYLLKWPYLGNDADLDHYAAASKIAAKENEMALESYQDKGMARQQSTKEFYRTLRAKLGQ
nr:TIR domain-containing protein [Gluconobacter cerinus]